MARYGGRGPGASLNLLRTKSFFVDLLLVRSSSTVHIHLVFALL
jgi:hypothetical protein